MQTAWCLGVGLLSYSRSFMCSIGINKAFKVRVASQHLVTPRSMHKTED